MNFPVATLGQTYLHDVPTVLMLDTASHRAGVAVSPGGAAPRPPTPLEAAAATKRSSAASGVSGGITAGGGGRGVADGGHENEISLRELHVFCRAVRVSIIDGEYGEMVLGSLEGMSMSVAATAREVDVRFKLGSLQVDSHMPG